jgi:hypothetical protein
MSPHLAHTAGDTEAAQHVSGAVARWLRTQPVLAALLALELPVLGAIVLAVLNGDALTIPGVALMIAAPLVPAILAGVRTAVTPTAKPQLDDGIPLVPVGDPEPPDEP